MNQRKLAQRLGLSQSTISLALRGDSSIPISTQKRVLSAAKKNGYHLNPQVAALMRHIRQGEAVRDSGCLGIVVDAKDESGWLTHPAYAEQYHAIKRRASARGYSTECFYLQDASMSSGRLDQILRARGISGLILAAPKREGGANLTLEWDRYACVISGHTWTNPPVDRISTNHRHNVEIAFAQLQLRGYERIGFCLPKSAQMRVDSNWLAGWLLCQHRMPKSHRIPCFTGSPWDSSAREFSKWLTRWKPDSMISLIGNEMEWLDELGIEAGRDLAIICLSDRPNSKAGFSVVNENNPVIGEMLCDAISALLLHNERGVPAIPRLIQIEGYWMEGKTTPPKKGRR